MKRPALLRAIFGELRQAFGPEIPTRDLARLATAIVRSYLEDVDELAAFGLARETKSLHSMPVDEAIKLGWRVVAFEEEGTPYLDEMEERRLRALRPLIESYLGPEWRQQKLTGQF
jgi:hypothetical protein